MRKISDEQKLSQKIDIAWIYLVEKMSIKESVKRLEKDFKIKFPELDAGC